MNNLINFYRRQGVLTRLGITLMAEKAEMDAYSNNRNWELVERILFNIQSTRKAIERIKSLQLSLSKNFHIFIINSYIVKQTYGNI